MTFGVPPAHRPAYAGRCAGGTPKVIAEGHRGVRPAYRGRSCNPLDAGRGPWQAAHMPLELQGLRTIIYPAPDLDAARAWWTRALGRDPYFDQPFYVGYD